MTEPSRPSPGALPENPKRWTDTFVTHSQNSMVHKIRFSFYEKVFFDAVKDVDYAILDIGCGSGDFLRLLQGRGFRNLYGVEIDDSLLAMSKDLSAEIVKSSAAHLPFEDQKFDCIYIYNVMHHLNNCDEYEKVIAEVTRCLKKNGTFILIEPCNIVLYGLIFAASFVLRYGSGFFRTFNAILDEEWPCLTYFIKNINKLRDDIIIPAGFSCVKEKKKYHQWIAVFRRTMT